MRSRSYFALFIILGSLCACTGEVGYKPPVVPITINVDTNGNIDFGAEASFVTPIGEFSLGASVPVRESEKCYLLTIRDRRKAPDRTDAVYCIQSADTGYQVRLNKSDAIIEVSSSHAIIDITTGTVHTIIVDPTSVQNTPLPQQTDLSITAQQGWQSTGIVVQQGQVIELTYQSGTWTWTAEYPHFRADGDPEPANTCGAVTDRVAPGVEPVGKYCPSYSDPIGILMGKIGRSEPFAIGMNARVSTDVAGELFLTMNDTEDGYGDNAGQIIVHITVMP